MVSKLRESLKIKIEKKIKNKILKRKIKLRGSFKTSEVTDPKLKESGRVH